MKKPVVCFFTLSAGDWGGASRVLFTSLRLMQRGQLKPLLLLPNQGPIEEELKENALSYFIWGPFTESGHVLSYIRGVIRAWRFFRKHQVSVIHVNGSNFWRPAEILAAKLLQIPIIIHYHVINDQPSPFATLCDAAICVSRYTAEHSLPKKIDKPVIYNPINLDRFDSGKSLRQDLNIPSRSVVVAFLGQIREIKGVKDFIEMAKQIPDADARFILAGECRDPVKFAGSYSEQDLREFTAGDPRIRYIGYVKQVEDVYHSADIVVVPSHWQEPLGLINLEAGACRKPVVAYRVGGIPEIIRDGENGFLVEPQNVAGLVARVKQLIDDAVLRDKMGEAGRRLVENEFTDQPIAEFHNLLLRYATKKLA